MIHDSGDIMPDLNSFLWLTKLVQSNQQKYQQMLKPDLVSGIMQGVKGVREVGNNEMDMN
jgi:hypothetical protein